MAQAYLFVHFREKTTPDGEQVYFGISRDGFHWEAVNDGVPGAGQDMCRLLQTALLPENLFVLMLPSRSHTATSMERFFRLQRRITSGSKPGLVRSRISVKSLSA